LLVAACRTTGTHRSFCRGRRLQREYGADAHKGLLLYDGAKIEWLTPTVLAAPWWMVI